MNSPAMEIATSNGEDAGQLEVEAEPVARKKRDAESSREVIQRDQREGAKSPEDEGVGEAGQRPLRG